MPKQILILSTLKNHLFFFKKIKILEMTLQQAYTVWDKQSFFYLNFSLFLIFKKKSFFCWPFIWPASIVQSQMALGTVWDRLFPPLFFVRFILLLSRVPLLKTEESSLHCFVEIVFSSSAPTDVFSPEIFFLFDGGVVWRGGIGG